jgi:amidase
MAHGNDAGGSIRIPASCCGLIGLKPGRARVPLGPLYGDLFTGIVSEFALTRSVRDTAALLEAVAGPMRGDPYFAPPPERPYTQETERPPGRLRIGFSMTTPLGDPVDDACVAAVTGAADLCASLGHEVEEAAPSFDAESLWAAFTTLLCSGTAWAVRDWTRRLGRAPGPDDLEPFVAAFVRRGEALSASQLLLAVQDVQRGVRDLLGFYRHHHVWLTPTLGQPPVPLGTLVYRDGEDPFELRRRTARFSPFTYLSNASGQPAISLPLHWTDDGLPVGVLFTADHGGEGVLLRLAAHIEQARPWAARRPGVCAV